MSKILEIYRKRTPKSEAAQHRAVKSVVGGNSRGSAYWSPYPLTIDRASGTRLIDIDGNAYIDLLNNYTSLAHGHTYPPIVEAVTRQVELGTAWVGNNRWQNELAETLIERVPSVESIRFANSGTEAGMLALTIARVVTGRNKVLMARYGYHGSLMEFEVGSFPDLFSHGADNTYLGTYNDAQSFEEILRAHGEEIAAVFLEPVMGAGGVVRAAPEFLKRVQAAARGAGALFVLDEVIAFRLATGGAQSLLGVDPDLTMFGKVIGGGFPVGAVGGKLEHLKVFDPKAPRALHSGTFNANPVTMAAGLVSVRELTAQRIDQMDKLGARLADTLATAAHKLSLPVSINRAGSLLNVFFTARPPQATPVREDAVTIALFHLAAMNHGLMPAGRGMIALSTVMNDALIDEIGQRAAAAMADVADEIG